MPKNKAKNKEEKLKENVLKTVKVTSFSNKKKKLLKVFTLLNFIYEVILKEKANKK